MIKEETSEGKMELFMRWSAVLGSLAAGFVLHSLVRSWRVYSRLRAFKGPWPAGFSKLWLLRAQVTGECHLHLARANEEYGAYPLGSAVAFWKGRWQC